MCQSSFPPPIPTTLVLTLILRSRNTHTSYLLPCLLSLLSSLSDLQMLFLPFPAGCELSSLNIMSSFFHSFPLLLPWGNIAEGLWGKKQIYQQEKYSEMYLKNTSSGQEGSGPGDPLEMKSTPQTVFIIQPSVSLQRLTPALEQQNLPSERMSLKPFKTTCAS